MPVQPSVVWITSGFPYGGGEQFIETEVPHWAEFKGRVIFLPENHMGGPPWGCCSWGFFFCAPPPPGPGPRAPRHPRWRLTLG